MKRKCQKISQKFVGNADFDMSFTRALDFKFIHSSILRSPYSFMFMVDNFKNSHAVNVFIFLTKKLNFSKRHQLFNYFIRSCLLLVLLSLLLLLLFFFLFFIIKKKLFN
jgi:hypothetical protein